MGKSIREVYGTVLAELGDTNENIVVLDADLSGSTKSGIFAKAHPERHFNMGIAESDMVATAAGLSTTGKIPFVNTFTVFLTTLGLISARAQVCYGNLNVKFGGAYCGMSDALDGATHHATEDIAVMRSLPNMTVLVPSDAASTRWATKYAVDTYGPMYLRLSRDVYPDLYDENTKFECGKGAIVRDGTDVTVIACGILVHKAIEAAEQMAERGVSVRVVDMYSIKPIDRELILRCAQETGAIVTAEEHNVIGGLGGAVAEVAIDQPLHATLSGKDATVISAPTSVGFHRNGVALVTRPMDLPMGNKNAYVASADGLGVRVVFDYDSTHKIDTVSFDILYGVTTLDKNMIVKVQG